MLESHPGWEVCAEASNGRTAVKLAQQLKPNIAVIDLELPDLNGLEATRQIKKNRPETKVLFLTMYDDEDYLVECMDVGAGGYVLKDSPAAQLLAAIRDVPPPRELPR